MKRVAALLTMLVVISTANPVMEIALSEIQTAPDSLERIEFHMYSGLGGGHDDLSGAQVITNAGTAVIDSGMVLTADNYLVVDRSNTTGTFSLGDDSDYIRIQFPGEPEPIFSLRYPANPFRAYDASWTPPPGASASIFQWWEWQNGEWFDYYTWYVDETPTFGERNDDTLGGISGYVRDDRGLPVDGAAVRMTSSQGTAAMTSGLISYWPAGYFEEKPTGPGTFTVTAE